jgi:predicted CXXCH cytochrome family protein
MIHMRNYRARTALELGLITAVVALMALFIRPGQGTEDFRKIHGGVDCVKCHAPVADIAESEFIPDATSQCLVCHSQERLTAGSRLLFHRSEGRACVECHAFHRPDEITVRGVSFHLRFTRSNQQALCGSCHSEDGHVENISGGHLRAAQLYHSDNQVLTGLSASSACLLCHSSEMNRTASMASTTLELKIPEFADHGHPVGVPVIPGSGQPGNRIRERLDPRLPLFDQKMECQTCHSLTGSDRYLLTASMSSQELCQGCHQVD